MSRANISETSKSINQLIEHLAGRFGYTEATSGNFQDIGNKDKTNEQKGLAIAN